MIKLGVIHYNFPGFSFEQFLKFAADTGFGFVELQITDIWEKGETNPETNAERVRRQVEAHGLRVSALAAQNDFVQADPDAVRIQVSRMKKVCQVARILDQEAVIRSEGGQPKPGIPEDRWLDCMADCFERCLEFVQPMGIGIAIDNHGMITNDGDLLYALIRRINSPLFGSNLDTMNFRWRGNDVPTCNRFYEILAPHVLHTHIKDGFGSLGDYRGAALGDGEIDLRHALTCLRNAGYRGTYTAEYEGPEAAGGVGYAKCFRWLQQELGPSA